MNILPKKNWHVRNKDNVAKVRRDEQKAKEDTDELELRNALAEKEAKLNLLRSKHSRHASGKEESQSTKTQQNINFFQEFEDQLKAVPKSNAEYEAEKKAEKEAFEKKVGILTYLGQSASKDEMPWYLKNSGKRKSGSSEQIDNSAEKGKSLIDPLQEMQKHLKKMKSSKEKDKETSKSKKKSKYREIIDELKSSSGNIEELRAKRLKREREERLKADRLLKGSSSKHEEKEERYDPNRYSSQYNPQFARKPRDHRRYEPY